MNSLLTQITFPRLGSSGWSFNIDRVAFSIFGLNVYWYGLIIAIGFLLAVIYCFRLSKKYNLNPDDLTNFRIFAVPLSIIGARAYYVFFKYQEYYYGNPQLIYRIWDGGLAIYGAVIAGVITAIVFCRIRRIRIGTMLDICAMGLLIGQCIGRWGNFVNGEAYGSVTYAYPWIMQVNGGPSVHPCFLYESLWNLVGFIILHFYTKKRRYCGEIFLLYVAWYGFGRGLIEGLRADSLYLFGTGLRVSQALGFASCVVALGILVYLYLFRESDPEKLANPYYAKTRGRKGEEAQPAAAADETVELMAGDEEAEDDASFYGEEPGAADETEYTEPQPLPEDSVEYKEKEND